MKILIIDNNIEPQCWGSPDLRRMLSGTPGLTVYVRRGPAEDLPENPRSFDKIIISGSKTPAYEEAPWVDQQLHFIRKTIHQQVPLLGVCFGHQAIARALGGIRSVGKSKTPEYGWSQIRITHSSPLFEGLPRTFYSFSHHQDEVSHLPLGMKTLANSERCAIQAVQLENQPVFGIQFHPERSLEEAKASLKRLTGQVDKTSILMAERSTELFNPKWGEILFKNFLELKSVGNFK